jgi:hypothetical protein
MSTEVLGILDDVIPAEIADETYLSRLRWHTERIRRTEPVFDFLESLEHEDLDEEQLVDEIYRVRHELHKLRVEIQLRSTPRLTLLKMRLAHAAAKMKYSLGDIREGHRLDIAKYEAEIREICEQIGTSFRPHIVVRTE